jgi:hypothetical protein
VGLIALHLFYNLNRVSLSPHSIYIEGMSSALPGNRAEYDSPATYWISVQGHIPANWCDCLEGMTITQSPPQARPPLTTLMGELSDQAALAGVLNTLYELHLPLLTVKRLRQPDLNR